MSTGPSRGDLPEPLSGLPEQPVVELGVGFPWLTLSEINRLVRQQGLAPRLARAWVLDELVSSIRLDPERERQLIRTWVEEHGVHSEEELDRWLQHKRLRRRDLPILATQKERLAQFCQERWGEDVEVQFLRRKADLDQVVYSLLRVSDKALAEELHHRLQDDGADFGVLAQQYAEGRERHSRGLIGPLPITAAHPQISSRLRVGQPGQLWPPFPVDRFWVLLRLDERLPARLNEETRSRMMDELLEAWLQSRVELLLAGESLPSLPPPQQP
jgi:parvulin-like peptidyl-prolyl isomerase